MVGGVITHESAKASEKQQRSYESDPVGGVRQIDARCTHSVSLRDPVRMEVQYDTGEEETRCITLLLSFDRER